VINKRTRSALIPILHIILCIYKKGGRILHCFVIDVLCCRSKLLGQRSCSCLGISCSRCVSMGNRGFISSRGCLYIRCGHSSKIRNPEVAECEGEKQDD